MKRTAAQPTLREKIGQMLLVGFRGYEVSDQHPIARDLAEGNLGGVILFDEEMADASLTGRNIKSPGQVKALVNSLRRLARTPPFVAIDQEGGRVNRLKSIYGFPGSLSHEELGTVNVPAQTFAHAQQTARLLADLGINLNLAPVVDLAAHPDNPIITARQRSFSSDPQIVARHAIAFVQAHRELGVMTCAKHFPGHGSAGGDTHLGMVDVTNSWTEQELIPFQRLIAAGACDVIMTAHLFNARLDSNRPATLSQPVLRGLLRQRFGFDGVILSDDMEMKAISNQYTLKQSVQDGIEAGLDVLCFGNNMSFDANIGRKAARIIEGLVTAGKIPETRIDESFQRVQNLKRKFKLI